VIYVINNNILYPFFLLNITIFLCFGTGNAYAHISLENKTLATIQQWENQQDKITIQFSYSPKRPLIYTETELIFSVQDLNTRDHIRDLVASITITKGDRIFFKFNNVNIQNGDLPLKIRFVEDGDYQVISHIKSTNNVVIALASFGVLVPLQPLGKFNTDSLVSSLVPAGLVAIVFSAIVIALILISRKRDKAKNSASGGER
jgi:hypothetical protein